MPGHGARRLSSPDFAGQNIVINGIWGRLIGNLGIETKTFPETVRVLCGVRAVWRPPLSPPAGVAPYLATFRGWTSAREMPGSVNSCRHDLRA